MIDKSLKQNKVTTKTNETDFWKKWWNSFEKADLKRIQGKQKRKDIFELFEK